MSLAERQERDLACPIEFMRLTLTYDGPLPAANGKNPRRAEKNDIRRYIQPQIKEALQAHPALDNGERFKLWTDLEPSEQYSDHPNRFFVAYKIGSYGFLPLITRKHHMVCELDILFLRREQPGALVHDGDLDNRLKVLFDALRMPLNNDELEGLRDEPEPFCCLLADDSLITAVNVRTEQWYQPPAPDTSPSNLRLVIDVLIRVTRVTYANIGLGG